MTEGVDAGLVERLARALRAGEAVVIPTDTVYGVAALPGVPGATARLFALKDRRAEVALAVLVADPPTGRALAEAPDERLVRVTDRLWPGPLTLVLRRAGAVAAWPLGGDPGKIGVRCPAHPLVRALAREVGPVATTSANRHGQPTPTTAVEAAASLTGPVAVVADGGALTGTSSTVVDATGPVWRVVRPGPLTLADVEEAAG